MACPRCGCRMPARSTFGLVCADCGTPLDEGSSGRPGCGWGGLVAVACATLLTTGAYMISGLTSESPTLAETHPAQQLSDARAAE